MARNLIKTESSTSIVFRNRELLSFIYSIIFSANIILPYERRGKTPVRKCWMKTDKSTLTKEIEVKGTAQNEPRKKDKI